MKPYWYILLMLSFAGCADKESGGTQDNEYPDEVYETGLAGLSGLCCNKDKTAMLAVCDNGKIYEIGFDGSVLRQLPFSGSNDFEGIATDTRTGKIYVADEGAMSVYELQNESSLSLVAHVDIPGAQSNKGIEGVACGKDILYVVNQENPLLLITYSLAEGRETGRKPLTYASFLSDICYDPSDDTLWIVDSKLRIVTHRTLAGDVIDHQEIPEVQKGEALLIDRSKKLMWVGCDHTGRIYRFKLKI